jgi:hypothetical protein
MNHQVMRGDVAVGVLIPGVLLGTTATGERCVYGPRGLASVTDAADAWPALVATGSVLLGSEEAVVRLTSFLEDERTSRTASYVCCVVDSCDRACAVLSEIRSSVVALLGCGGIGSLSALLLAGAGIGSLRLVDHDRIERSNLNRQLLWSERDIGRAKVDVLAERIVERFPNTAIDVRLAQVDESELPRLMSDVDGVLLTADEPLGLGAAAGRIADAQGTVLVTAGYVLAEANVALVREPSSLENRAKWDRGPSAIMPSFGPTNAELAGHASGLLIHALAGLIPTRNSIYTTWDTTTFPRLARHL